MRWHESHARTYKECVSSVQQPLHVTSRSLERVILGLYARGYLAHSLSEYHPIYMSERTNE